MDNFFTILAGTILAALVILVLLAFPAMLMFGVVHGFWAAVPALGFWETLLVMILLRFIMPVTSVTD